MLDAERLGAAVRLAQVAPVTAGRAVDVFDEVARLVEPARAEVDRQHHLSAGRLAPFSELVHADRVRFRGVPGQVEPGRALLARADAVLPVVGRHEVAAGIADDRHVELAHEVDHVATHAVGVGGRMAGLVDAGVDGAAEVFEERAIEPVVDGRDGVVAMGGGGRFHVSSPFYIRMSDIYAPKPAASSSRPARPFGPTNTGESFRKELSLSWRARSGRAAANLTVSKIRMNTLAGSRFRR